MFQIYHLQIWWICYCSRYMRVRYDKKKNTTNVWIQIRYDSTTLNQSRNVMMYNWNRKYKHCNPSIIISDLERSCQKRYCTIYIYILMHPSKRLYRIRYYIFNLLNSDLYTIQCYRIWIICIDCQGSTNLKLNWVCVFWFWFLIFHFCPRILS